MVDLFLINGQQDTVVQYYVGVNGSTKEKLNGNLNIDVIMIVNAVNDSY